MYNLVYSTLYYNFIIVGNVLLCVIYQLNFTVFMYVTRYITLYIAFGIIRGFT